MTHGLVLKKIHRILAFKQTRWLKPYIEFNNEKRKLAVDDFQKNFYKKMNNSFFGRTMMNVRKRVSVKGALNEEQCKRYLASPLLDYFEPVSDTLVLFKMKKANLILNSPIFLGFVILEISKWWLYKLYYEHFKAYFGSSICINYLDTDSLYMTIKSPNLNEQLKTHFSDILDLSNYDVTHELHDPENKGRLGCLKSETCLPIHEFVGLRPKMYSFLYAKSGKRTAKGVKKTLLALSLMKCIRMFYLKRHC